MLDEAGKMRFCFEKTIYFCFASMNYSDLLGIRYWSGSLVRAVSWSVQKEQKQLHMIIIIIICNFYSDNFQLWFLSRSTNGVLLYNGGQSSGSGDFISINIINGIVQLSYDLGSGVAKISSLRSEPIIYH